MDTQHLKELMALQEENSSLKHMFVHLSMDQSVLKDITENQLQLAHEHL